ncbi:MAG: hypothetical protein NQ127_02800 [Candidatus Cardinium sp.]|nr:hypothetical protein [Candidatus Cardinium sp.]
MDIKGKQLKKVPLTEREDTKCTKIGQIQGSELGAALMALKEQVHNGNSSSSSEEEPNDCSP